MKNVAIKTMIVACVGIAAICACRIVTATPEVQEQNAMQFIPAVGYQVIPHVEPPHWSVTFIEAPEISADLSTDIKTAEEQEKTTDDKSEIIDDKAEKAVSKVRTLVPEMAAEENHPADRADDQTGVSAGSEESDYSEDVIALAKMAWGEARGCGDDGIRAVMWCVMHRVDSDEFPGDVVSVVTQKSQFYGYRSGNPVDEHIAELATEVIADHAAGAEPMLPEGYVWFTGDGVKNVFTNASGERWTV